MWRADQPSGTVRDVADLIAQHSRELRSSALVNSVPLLVQLESIFVNSTTDGKAWKLDPSAFDIPGIDKNEMAWYYEKLKDKGPVRSAYDAVLAQAQLNLCPYCHARNAETIDHYLPKAKFAGLAITPWNLVPACSTCNTALSDSTPTSGNESIFHVYSEEAVGTWLTCTISGPPIGVIFGCDVSSFSDNDMAARVSHQFHKLKLGRIYGRISSRPLAEMSFRLESKFPNGGASDIAEFLESEASISRRLFSNDWKAVLFEACAVSDWYCSGGFR